MKTKKSAHPKSADPNASLPESVHPKNDKLIQKSSLLAVFVVICVALVLMVIVNLQVRSIIGTDFNTFHAKIALEYSQGKNALFSDTAMEVNGGPYPPLFHLLFAGLLLIGMNTALFFVYAFQVLFYPAILACTLYLVYRKMDIRAAAFTGVIMLASIALVDRGMQVTPQAVDMILFPLAILFFLDNRKVAYIITMAAMIYNHGIWAYLHFGAILVYSLWKKRNILYNVWAFVASLPLFILTLIYLPGYFGSHGGGLHSRQEELASSSTQYLILYMGIIVSVLIAGYITYLIVQSIRKKGFPYKLSELEQIAVIWIIALIPIFLFIRDRFLSYAVPPIAIILAGWMVRELRQRKYFISTLMFLTILSMLFTLISWVHYFPTNDHLFIW